MWRSRHRLRYRQYPGRVHEGLQVWVGEGSRPVLSSPATRAPSSFDGVAWSRGGQLSPSSPQSESQDFRQTTPDTCRRVCPARRGSRAPSPHIRGSEREVTRQAPTCGSPPPGTLVEYFLQFVIRCTHKYTNAELSSPRKWNN